MTLPTVLAILPLVIFTVLLLSGRTLLSASFVVFAGYLLFGLFYFNVDPTLALAVIGKGALTAKDIFWIVFGALFFLEVLKLRLVLPALVKYLQTISADYRVQILLLVWFLEAFIEGTAGFGTPVALVSPILVAMGYSPLRAVALGLLGNSNAVVFGAAGTPIRVGFAGLDVVGVPTAAALFNLCGIFVPVLILWLGVRKRNDFWPFVPLALWAGVCLMVAEIVIVPLGSELPSILGPIV